MDELPPDARALLDVAAGADDPEPDERHSADARIRANLAARGMAGLAPLAPRELTRRRPPSSGDQAPTAGAGLGAGAALRVALGLSGMAIALVGIGFFALDGFSSPVAAPEREYPSAQHARPGPGPLVVPAPAPVAPAPEVAEGPPVSVVEQVPTRPARTQRRGPRAAVRHAPRRVEPREATGDGDDRVREELRLIAAADRAIRDGEPARALQLLGDHARRFRRGFLVAERRALRVLALCKQGKHAELTAAQRAQALRGAKSSVLAARLREACGLPSEEP